MRFESDYTKEEIEAILQKKTEQYSFYNLHRPDTLLGALRGNRVVLWRTKRPDSFCVTKLSNAFYGTIATEQGKTVIRGHFRLTNSDLFSWMTVFVLYMIVVFAATVGSVYDRIQNMGVMGLVWCVICIVALVIENILDRPQKRDVVDFIRQNLLKRDT